MMSQTLSTASEALQTNEAKGARTASWERLGILYVRIALGSVFLSPVADRFGLWGKYASWGNFAWNVCFYDLVMHCSFGKADALFVIAMQGQPLLRDLKMQFTKTAIPRCGAAVTLLRWWAQMSLRANLRSMGSR